jgi:hypothetical protein
MTRWPGRSPTWPLHGGNLFVRPDGRVALLTYGITGHLMEHKRLAFVRVLNCHEDASNCRPDLSFPTSRRRSTTARGRLHIPRGCRSLKERGWVRGHPTSSTYQVEGGVPCLSGGHGATGSEEPHLPVLTSWLVELVCPKYPSAPEWPVRLASRGRKGQQWSGLTDHGLQSRASVPPSW